MPNLETEASIDLYLNGWWAAIHTVKRRMALVVVLLIVAFAVGPLRADKMTPLWLVAFIWWMWPAVQQMLARSRRPLSVVLWLRRFHRGAYSRDLLRFWEGAVSPWGQVITLTDDDVRRPATALITVTLIGVAMVPLFLWLRSPVMNFNNFAVNLAFDIFLSVLFTSTVLFSIMKFSVTGLRHRSQLPRILRHTRRIRSQKFLVWSGGSGTIQCPPDNDDLWRLAVSTLAPEVGAIIVDIGEELSANVEWEAGELVRVCGPERLIFAFSERTASRGVSSPFEHAEIASRLSFLSGTHPRMVVYPSKVPRIAISKRYEAIVHPAQKIIGLVSQGVDARP